MFDIFPDNSHRTPQQIADARGGAFEPAPIHRTPHTDHLDDTFVADGHPERATRRGYTPVTHDDPNER